MKIGFAVALGMAASDGYAATDYNNDGYDDVWQQRHGITVSSYPLTSDYDGDGVTNLAESVAGTDPKNSLDVLAVTNIVVSGANIQVSTKTQSGKRYKLQSSAAPNGPTWADEGSPLTGNGTVQTFTVAMGSGTAPKFYRVQAEDQDTDGDGISDWAEGSWEPTPRWPTRPTTRLAESPLTAKPCAA
ncbi:hypothetical protein [Verrucomicrobium spinosum]|uniref:hypothetical protein n=1 Tax=Verrucomicrobium spinosum TaxID=2736 RepID=UPI00210BB030|nr:hypothetical protein [Verrucomicrobium spinosum]